MCGVEGKRVEAGDSAETVGAISVAYEGSLDQGESWEREAWGDGAGLMEGTGGLSGKGSQRSFTQPTCFTQGN